MGVEDCHRTRTDRRRTSQVLALIKGGTESKEGKLPFTPRAKATLRNAVEEALQLGHNYVGTEHLLLGILKDGNAVGAVVVARLGVTYDIVSARITEALSGSGSE